MTEKIFESDSYACQFDATVTNISNESVTLDRTAFYPGGGGQPSDIGRLICDGIDIPVSRVEKDGSTISHIIPPSELSVGSTVTGIIDWDHRYSLMRTHTALHILCGVIWRDMQAKVTGGNMTPLTARMDFELPELTQELANEIERLANEEIVAARGISVRFLDRAEAMRHPDLIRTKVNLLPQQIDIIRVVDIDGLDVQADGGTHVSNTNEVGYIRITGYESKGRINKRLRIAVEER